jgi:preprotein translocase subunit SecY
MGEMITEKGVGNGVSIIIFASIAARIPTVAESYVRNFFTGVDRWWFLPLMIIGVLLIVGGVTFIEKSERRIPVQYAKRVVGRKLYGGQSTHIPLKANANGVMPLIFAMTIMQFPAMIGQFWPNSGFYKFYQTYMSASSDNIVGPIVYYVIYALLILGFAYFYTTISFNPVEISKNLQQNGGFIPGIRPGRPTGEHLQKISNRLTLFGAVYLTILAVVPTVGLGAFDRASSFGPTSILIMVSVALETSQQLDSMMLMRHYKGFLN